MIDRRCGDHYYDDDGDKDWNDDDGGGYDDNHWRTGGGGLGGRLPPQMKFNHDLFQMNQQNIERNSSLRMWKCQNFLSSLAYTYIC